MGITRQDYSIFGHNFPVKNSGLPSCRKTHKMTDGLVVISEHEDQLSITIPLYSFAALSSFLSAAVGFSRPTETCI
jgi:hypothetical protein